MLSIRKAVAYVFALLASGTVDNVDFKLVDKLVGHDTQIERPRVQLVRDQQSLNAVWRDHRAQISFNGNGQAMMEPVDPPPAIDFKKNILLTVFGGQAQSVAGYDLVEIDKKGTTIKVRLAPVPFPGGASQNFVTNPYGMFVFPATKRAIDVEVRTGFEKGVPVYRKIAGFPAVKEKANSGTSGS